jgi:hypothetical protein
MLGAVALFALLGAAAPASATTTSKPYSLVIASGTPTYETDTNTACSSCATGPVNNEVAGGETVGVTARLTNETGTQQLGSANLFPPPGFSAKSVSPTGVASVASNCTLNGSPTGPCVQLRNLSLPPNGGTITVTMSVATPPGQRGPNAWQAEAKQANNFSGSPGNDLFLDSPNSQRFTFLDGASSLAFVNQPHNEVPTFPIDGATDWFTVPPPPSTPVTVEALGPDGQAVVSGFIGPITAAIDPHFNPGAGTLSGDTTEAASGGIASFSGLQVSAPGNGYRLDATSGTLTPTTSSPNPPPDDPTGFDVAGSAAPCSGPGNSCHTDQGAANSDALLTATVVSGSGLLLESVNATNAQLSCGSTANDPNTNTYTFLTTGDLVASKVAMITILGVKITGSVTKFLHAQDICFGAAVDFITASGTLAVGRTLPDGSAGFIGLLPNCTGSSTGPCHDENSDSATPVGPTYTVKLFADVPSAFTGDPWMK